MRASDRLGGAVLLAIALSLTALLPLTSDVRLYGEALVMIVAVTGSALLVRRIRPGALLPAGVSAGSGVLAWLGLAVASGVTSGAALQEQLAAALQATAGGAAPLQPSVGVRLVATSLFGLLAFQADQLASAAGRPGWTLLPIGLPYLICTLAAPGLAGFGALAALAAGYLLVLWADSVNRARAWRVPATAGWGAPLGVTLTLLVALGLAAAAGLTPGLAPGRNSPLLGRGPIQMGDPTLDIRRNLQQPDDRPVLTYSSSTGSGTQLRLTTLPGFDANGFHLMPIELAGGTLPPPPGAPAGRPSYSIKVTVADFRSEWLPLPYAPRSFRAAGDWRYDPVSLSVLASGANQRDATEGLSYDATAIDVTPTAEELAAAKAGRPADAAVTATVPADLPARIRDLATTITSAAETDGAKALMLQNWLRTSGFSYSTDPGPGSGYAALEHFLFDDRRGYCEQFATSMAALARAVGIPSRVSVGFRPGGPAGDSWEVSVRDMHAWPELYFEGLGWVAFEPTTGMTPPSFTASQPPSPPSPPASPAESPTPSPAESASPSPSPSAAPELPANPVGETPPNPTWPVWALGAALLVALAGTPWAVRRGRRTRRLAISEPRAAVLAAWAELRETVWDVGGEWPRGSPRQIGARLLPAPSVGAEDASAAIGRLALLVERARYADAVGAVDNLPGDLNTARRGVIAGTTRWWWRRLLPRSLWRRLVWRG